MGGTVAAPEAVGRRAQADSAWRVAHSMRGVWQGAAAGAAWEVRCAAAGGRLGAAARSRAVTPGSHTCVGGPGQRAA